MWVQLDGDLTKSSIGLALATMYEDEGLINGKTVSTSQLGTLAQQVAVRCDVVDEQCSRVPGIKTLNQPVELGQLLQEHNTKSELMSNSSHEKRVSLLRARNELVLPRINGRSNMVCEL